MRIPHLAIFIGFIAFQSTGAEDVPEGSEVSPFVVDASWEEERIRRLEAEHPARPKAYWSKRLEKIKVGITRKEVLTILGPYAFPSPTTLTGGANCKTYHLDKKWSWAVCYDNSGRASQEDIMYDRLLDKGEIIEMGWEVAVQQMYKGRKQPTKSEDAVPASPDR